MIYWFFIHDGVGGAVALRWMNALNHGGGNGGRFPPLAL